MSDRLFWVLFVLAAVGLAGVLAVIHTGIEAALRKRRPDRALNECHQAIHVRVIDQRQEINQ